MAFDNVCKQLAETYPNDFAAWLLGVPAPAFEVLKTELSLEPVRADSLTLFKAAEIIFHIEFQTNPESQPPLPFRMLDYWVRLARVYPTARIEQVIVLLRPTSVEVPSVFEREHTRHEYRIVKLWEQDPEELMRYEGLLPLAVLATAKPDAALMQRVAERIKEIKEPEKRGVVLTQANILAGLRYNQDLIERLLSEEVMEESVTYQAIIQKGVQQGIQLGIKQGKLEAETDLVLRQLARRLGRLDARLRKRIGQLSFEQLGNLGEALLDFTGKEDLTQWLRQNRTRKTAT